MVTVPTAAVAVVEVVLAVEPEVRRQPEGGELRAQVVGDDVVGGGGAEPAARGLGPRTTVGGDPGPQVLDGDLVVLDGQVVRSLSKARPPGPGRTRVRSWARSWAG